MGTEHKVLIGKKFKREIMRRQKTAESDAMDMVVEEETYKH
jgi:hypothetical protein